MKLSLDRAISKLTGRRWQYIITFQYQMYPGQPSRGNAESTQTFSVKDRNVLGDSHFLKKELAADMVKNLPKQMLVNGILTITSINYIGWYRDKPNKVRTGKIGHKPKPFPFGVF